MNQINQIFDQLCVRCSRSMGGLSHRFATVMLATLGLMGAATGFAAPPPTATATQQHTAQSLWHFPAPAEVQAEAALASTAAAAPYYEGLVASRHGWDAHEARRVDHQHSDIWLPLQFPYGRYEAARSMWSRRLRVRGRWRSGHVRHMLRSIGHG